MKGIFKIVVFSAVVTSIYLFVYCLLLWLGLVKPALIMLAFSPMVMIWMVHIVLRYAQSEEKSQRNKFRLQHQG